MKFNLLKAPDLNPRRFGFFSHVGTWSDGVLCKTCGHDTSALTEPLLVKWEPGASALADFSWCGYTFIVTNKVRHFMEAENYECRFGKIEIVESNPKKKRKKGFEFYTGQELHWCIATTRLRLNEEKSGVKIEIDCKECSETHYSFKRQDLIISKKQWQGQKVFRIDQFGRSSATFITEDALTKLTAQEFTFLGHLEAGKIE